MPSELPRLIHVMSLMILAPDANASRLGPLSLQITTPTGFQPRVRYSRPKLSGEKTIVRTKLERFTLARLISMPGQLSVQALIVQRFRRGPEFENRILVRR